MAYLRSSTLNKSLSLDGVPLDNVALAADRQNLVDQFNVAVGPPGEVVEAMQIDFVRGRMPFQEMVSYVRYCEYMIHAAEQKEGAPSTGHPAASGGGAKA